MGFFEDVVNVFVPPPVQQAVQQNAAPVVNNVFNPVKNYANTLAGDTGRVIESPLRIAENVLRGDIRGAQDAGVKGVGSGLALGFNDSPFGYLTQTSDGKKILNSPTLNRYTLGYSGDYAGTQKAVRSFANTGYADPADTNSAVRFGVKTGLIVAGVKYGPEAASWIKKETAEWGAKEYLIGLGVAGAARAGDYQGAGEQLGLPPQITEYLPNKPRTGDPISSPGIGAPGVPSSNGSPFTGIGTDSSSGFEYPGVSKAGASVAALAAVVLGVYLLRKGKVI